MNWESLHDRLIRTARRHPPGDEVPYAFEKRVLARLTPRQKDDWSAISRSLWWAAGACSAIALAIGVWTCAPDQTPDNFSDALEQTILASVDEGWLDADQDFIDPILLR